MTDKLSLYNDALLLCGERSLSGLTEAREPRYLLDQVWDNGGVDLCLEAADWHFARVTLRMDPDPAISPEFGYQNAFDKPDDWVTTAAFCADEYFDVPITRYADEDRYWYADEDEVYVKYVSNAADRGNDIANWPVSFKEFAAAHFASKIVSKVSGDKNKIQEVFALRQKELLNAKNTAAKALPTAFPARGSWSRARHSRSGRERGNRNGSLIG